MWIAVLFDVLALGSQHLGQTPDTYQRSTSANFYLNLAAQAIAMEYGTTCPYTLEALILFVRSCQLQSNENQLKLWLILGMATRLGQHMGYHREPTETSPLDAEMRRRVWLHLLRLDVVSSHQMGMSSLLRNLPVTVTPPSNYSDADLLQDNSQPRDELTNVTATVATGQILPVFSAAVDQSHSPNLPPYTVVTQLDESLQRARDEIPYQLKIRPFDQSYNDSPSLVLDRIRLELLCQHTRCLLYRRYIGTSQVDARRFCMDASLVTLGIQKAFMGGRHSGDPLYSINPLHILEIIDSFVLASIVIGLELYTCQQASALAIYTSEERTGMTQALEGSCSIWIDSTIAPPKTRRIAAALNSIVLREYAIHDGSSKLT